MRRKKYVDGLSLFPPTPTPTGAQYTIYNNDTDELIGEATNIEEAVEMIQATDTPKKAVILNTDNIAANSFENCTNLASVYLPQESISIGNSAFKNSGLESITLPTNLTTIGSEAFSGTSLANITIPETVETIGENAFSNTKSLEEISLDSHYNEVAGFPWGSDDVLTTYNWLKTTKYEVYNYQTNEFLGIYDELSNAISAINGNNQEVLMVCPYGLETIGGRAEFQNCFLLKRIFLPSTLTTIPAPCFYGASGFVIGHIPRSVTNFGTHLFIDCTALKKVFIGSSTINTASNPQFFSNNTNLEYVYVCSSNVTDGFLANVHSQAQTARIILPNLVNSSAKIADYWNNTTFDCPSLANITTSSFAGMSNSTLNLPSLTTAQFSGNGMNSSNCEINIGNKLESIGEGGFNGLSDSTINIDLPQDAISGAPWGATDTTINWRG